MKKKMKDPRCKKCGRTLSNYCMFRRVFYKCICGTIYKGHNPKEKKSENTTNR